VASVQQIHGGWASFTFLVNGDHILRFARTAEVAAGYRREVALLPALAGAVSFRVPEPDFFFEAAAGGTCMGYPAIDGRPLTSSDDWSSLAGVLRELRSFPADVARAGRRPAGSSGRRVHRVPGR
jgi:Phosphotransferase enzyme family